VGETTAAGKVTRTADKCVNAHAILMASNTGNHARFWEAIYSVTKTRPYWEILSDYQPGVSQKMSFRQYDAKFAQGVTAYVAHCGHGATCNELAEQLLKQYPEIQNPVVYCGEVPHILDNPTSAPGPS
jgi:hypothetical protein